MQIANPIYDVVFKYLMDDNLSARMLISAIIEQEVEELELLPQESTAEVDLERRSMTVYRLDFAAKIKTPEGPKRVIIEIQKAKYAADIMRFRKYLGEQYSKKTEDGALPLVSIYFLGYALDHTDAPVIKVNRVYEDLTTHKVLDVKEDFIESLTHDSYVIQIPYLDRRHRSELEKMLTIFDQRQRGDDVHVLNIKEDDYPEHYRRLVRRLQRAVSEPKVRKTMDIEDEILEELENLERRIESQEKRLEEHKREILEKDKALDEKDKALGEKDKALGEKDKALDEKDKALGEKDRALDEKEKALEESRREIEELKRLLSDN